jgi:hypothetical protein
MVFEDINEAETYAPPMVQWIFSHIQAIVVRSVEEPVVIDAGVIYDTSSGISGSAEEENDGLEATEAEPDPEPDRGRLFAGRLYLGLHGGGVFDNYKLQAFGNYESGISQGLGGTLAALVEFGIFPFLSLRAEAVFTYDSFGLMNAARTGQQLVRSTAIFTAMSLTFPFLVQFPLAVDFLTLIPFGGVYVTMPLEEMKTKMDTSDLTSAYEITPPIGFLLGMEIGISLGPGDLFIDLRFGRDIGITRVIGDTGPCYFQERIGISLGYKFLLWRARKKP